MSFMGAETEGRVSGGIRGYSILGAAEGVGYIRSKVSLYPPQATAMHCAVPFS